MFENERGSTRKLEVLLGEITDRPEIKQRFYRAIGDIQRAQKERHRQEFRDRLAAQGVKDAIRFARTIDIFTDEDLRFELGRARPFRELFKPKDRSISALVRQSCSALIWLSRSAALLATDLLYDIVAYELLSDDQIARETIPQAYNDCVRKGRWESLKKLVSNNRQYLSNDHQRLAQLLTAE